MRYLRKSIEMWINHILVKINEMVLPTYYPIADCARCRDCGRNVHDFFVPDKLWVEIMGNKTGVFCFDCFADRAWKRGIYLTAHCSTKWISDEIS